MPVSLANSLQKLSLRRLDADSLLGRAARQARNHVAPYVYGAGGHYLCPLCAYSGPFINERPETGLRRHARCPRCNALERHRLQWAVVKPLLASRPGLRLLHVAPEPCLASGLSQLTRYITGDLFRRDVDHRIDLTDLPFRDGYFDVVYASHVLEHISDDGAAIREVRRVLRPGGFAVLPVPVIGGRTIEYGAPNPHEAGHVRCPGIDYFGRYRAAFTRVDVVTSDEVPGEIQPYVYEDQTRWPPTMPLRPAVPGDRHLDYVPICQV
jgi:SAM-dependent methyltransferase